MESALDGFKLIDPANIYLRPSFAAESLGITVQTLHNIEKANDLVIDRVQRGAVSERAYKPSDIFKVAALRREKGQLKGFSQPVIIATYVQKGGTGKSTLSVNQAINMSLMGLKVLLVDNDPQGDSTSMLGYDPDLEPDELEEMGIPRDRGISGHLGNLLRLNTTFEHMELKDVIKKPFGEDGPHLIPADNTLDELDTVLRSTLNSDFRYMRFFHKAMSEDQSDREEGRAKKKQDLLPPVDLSAYDVVIIDNAPSTSMLSRNAMVAADFLLTPIRLDRFSFRSLSRLHARLSDFHEDFSRSPYPIAVPTFFVNGRPRFQANLKRVADLFPDGVTETIIFNSEDYTKSLEDGIPLAFWKQATPNSLDALRDLSKEVVGKIHAVLNEKDGDR